MRILLTTNSAATRSSYGIVAREVWTRILAADPTLEVIQHGWFHKPVENVLWEILPTNNPNVIPNPDGSLPPMPDVYGAETYVKVLQKVRPEIVWGLGDPWMLEVQPEMKAHAGYKYLYYIPVDSEPYTPRWGDNMAKADELITITNYGKEVLQEVPQLKEKKITVIPHGVDLKIFNQADKKARQNYRKEIGNTYVTDDTFILGWIGKDQYRKQIWQLYELMYYLRSGEYYRCPNCDNITVVEYDPNLREPRKLGKLRFYDENYKYDYCNCCGCTALHKAKPRDNIILWSHMRNAPHHGYDLKHLAYIYRIDNSIYDASQCIDDGGLVTQALNYIYNCMDAFLFPTGGEGFGLPALEAMACGVPVIYANYSGHTSFVEGLPVKVRIYPEVRTQRYRAICDMGDMIRQVIKLADDKDLRSRLSKRGLKAASKMDWDAFTQNWLDVIHRAEESTKVYSIGETI